MNANANEPQVVYAEAVPVEQHIQAAPPLPIQVQSTLAVGEQARCRDCGRMYNRDPRLNDCDARYYRCERCGKPRSAEIAILMDTCVIS